MAPDLQDTNRSVLSSVPFVIAKAFLPATPQVLQYFGRVLSDNLTNCGRKKTLQTSSEFLPSCFSYCHFAIARLSRVTIQDDVVTEGFNVMYKCVILRITPFKVETVPV